MPASMDVILLERVSSLGNLGDHVKVKPGYARNYLLPQNKALRATKENIAYFESQKKEIEKRNNENKKQAEARAKDLKGLSVVLIRHAAEGGQLYGSVTAGDIAEVISEQSKDTVTRGMIEMNQSFKLIGLFTVPVALHPEVVVEVDINIARTPEEGKIQAKTGKALIIGGDSNMSDIIAKAELELEEASENAKKSLMENEALEIEKEKAEAQSKKEEEDSVKRTAKEEKNAAKKAAALAALPEDQDSAAEDQALQEQETGNDKEDNTEETEG